MAEYYAYITQCPYCLASHTKRAKKAGGWVGFRPCAPLLSRRQL